MVNAFENDFILFLNTLHNYNAQNNNAYAENSIQNAYFSDVMVENKLCDYIVEIFGKEDSQVVILTGHAGDGKTSVMYQVFKKLGLNFDTSVGKSYVNLANSKRCLCVKDFSEFSDIEKRDTLKEAIEFAKNGDFSFIVANTGPLINTFGLLFDDPKTKEEETILLVEAMDSNSGVLKSEVFKNICVINVANIDNTYFANKFIDKITAPVLWEKCSQCSRKKYCHILNNRNLISDNIETVHSFVNNHFSWLTEHGKRLTIRSMTEQLSFMLTGGLSCNEIKADMRAKLIFSNLFFGYRGLDEDARSLNIAAIKQAHDSNYYKKKFYVDEELIINRSFNSLFPNDVVPFLEKVCQLEQSTTHFGVNEYIKRLFIFCNLITVSEQKSQFIKDVFSNYFERFLKIKNGTIKPGKQDVSLIIDALGMIYVSSQKVHRYIPITLSRENGFIQNVQLIIGEIDKNKLSLIVKETCDGKLTGIKRNNLYVKIDKECLDTVISLPLINYFEELRNGIISTNIDPQLSHGIESFKAQISRSLEADEEIDTIVIAVRKKDEVNTIPFELPENFFATK